MGKHIAHLERHLKAGDESPAVAAVAEAPQQSHEAAMVEVAVAGEESSKVPKG